MPHNRKEWFGKQVAGRWDGVSEVDLSIPPILAAKLLLFMENGGLDELIAEYPLAYAGAGELRECIDHLLTGHKVREEAVEAEIEPVMASVSTDLPSREPGASVHKNPPSPRISRILENQVTDRIVADLAQAAEPLEAGWVPPVQGRVRMAPRIGRNPQPYLANRQDEFGAGRVGL